MQRQALLQFPGSEPENEVALLRDLRDDDAGALRPDLRVAGTDPLKQAVPVTVEVIGERFL
jgi:hypothetical protein